MLLKIKRLSPDATLPFYGTADAACFDIHAFMEVGDAVTLGANSSTVFATGLAFGVPKGYCLDIRSRSGLAFKDGIFAFPGTIDADYTGEVMVMLTNTGNKSKTFTNGSRIAQAKLTKVHGCNFEEVAELETTARGDGGFGSTGA